MNNCRNFLLSLAGLALLAAPLLRADDPAPPPPPGDGPEHHRERGAMMERAAKELGLTPDQEAKWKEIGQQERTALEAIRADANLTKEDKRAKAMETNKTFGDQRRAILNADQQKKFDDMRARMRERRRNDELPPVAKPPGQ